jgi:hypothetical protein
MFERCRKCGARLAATALLCLTCGTSTAALPVDAAIVLPPHHIVVMAMPPGASDPPHAPDEWPTEHIGSADMSAGGGGTIQAGVQLSGEGHLTGGAPFAPEASLSGEGSLTAGSPMAPAASLTGSGSLTAG